MNHPTGNLHDQCDDSDELAPATEIHRDLASIGNARIARIVSKHHASPDGFWYDQNEPEWVMVVNGDAVIEFDDGSVHAMGPGDWISIGAHVRHRIAGTSGHTVWLAVYGNHLASRQG